MSALLVCVPLYARLSAIQRDLWCVRLGLPPGGEKRSRGGVPRAAPDETSLREKPPNELHA